MRASQPKNRLIAVTFRILSAGGLSLPIDLIHWPDDFWRKKSADKNKLHAIGVIYVLWTSNLININEME